MKNVKRWVAGFLALSLSFGNISSLQTIAHAEILPTGDMDYIESVEPVEIIDISNLATSSDVLYASASDAFLEDGEIIDDISTESLFTAYSESLDQRLYTNGYNYAHLSSLHQDIYNAMLTLANTGNSTDRILIATGNSDAIMTRDILNSLFALFYDHPELFWLWQRSIQNGTSSNTATVTSPFRVFRWPAGNSYQFYISLKEDKTAEDISKIQELEETVRQMIARIEEEYGDLNLLPPAALALIAHDALLDQVTYDTVAAGALGNAADNAHTAYGALVEGSGVCDGYSLGYVYLLDKLGIDATMITGTGNGGGHAWTIVRLADKQNPSSWYEVDATWNDTAGNQHTYFNITTAQMRAQRHIRIQNTPAYNSDLEAFTTSWPTANANHFTYSYLQNIGEILNQTDTYGREIDIYQWTENGIASLADGQSFSNIQIAPAANIKGDIDDILWAVDGHSDTRLVDIDAWTENKPYFDLTAIQNGDVNIALYLIFDNGDRVALSQNLTATVDDSSSIDKASSDRNSGGDTTDTGNNTSGNTDDTNSGGSGLSDLNGGTGTGNNTSTHTEDNVNDNHTNNPTESGNTSSNDNHVTESKPDRPATETPGDNATSDNNTSQTGDNAFSTDNTEAQSSDTDNTKANTVTEDNTSASSGKSSSSSSRSGGGGGGGGSSRISVSSNLSMTASKTKSGTWIKDQYGWWYRHTDGTYSTNAWEYINGFLYHFNSYGYALGGWAYLYSSADKNYRWYYMHPTNLNMMTGWVQVGAEWYYLQNNGTLLTNATTPDGYKVNANGVWTP